MLGDVLAPLVRLLIATGVDSPRLAAELKLIFIEQAHQELLHTGRADTDSAISLLSGVHRKDIRKWRETGLKENLAREVSLSTQIYARWVQDPRYLDRRRHPQSLPRLGPEPSFESLVRSVTQDVRPYTVLAELMRLGLAHVEVRQEQEFVVPKKEGFVPPPGSQEMLELFAGNLSDHAAAAVANMTGTPARLEQSVFANGITDESAEMLGKLARKLWAEARAEMIALATKRYEQDQARPDATRRMRFGAYYWDEEMAPETDAAAKEDGIDEPD